MNVRNELGEMEEVILKSNLTIQGIVYSANKDENNQRQIKELWTFNFTWDHVSQKYKAEIPLKYEQSGFAEPINLAGTNLIRIFAASVDSNFDPIEDVAYVTIERGVEVVPRWIWYIVALSVGSVSIVGAAGIRKALQLRIPFILRMIDESIDKISKDKFPTVGIMLGRREFVINKVIDYLDICGIEWAIDDKIESADVEGADEGEEGGSGSGSSGAPMTMQEITVALNKLEHLTPDERALFIDELKRLDRKGQEEFLQSLKEDTK